MNKFYYVSNYRYAFIHIMQNYPKYCMEIQIFNNIYYCLYTFIHFLAANIVKKIRTCTISTISIF